MATVTHLPESFLLNDAESVLARARAGEEIILDGEGFAVRLSLVRKPQQSTLEECLKNEQFQTALAGLDGSFEADMNGVLAESRKAWDPHTWE